MLDTQRHVIHTISTRAFFPPRVYVNIIICSHIYVTRNVKNVKCLYLKLYMQAWGQDLPIFMLTKYCFFLISLTTQVWERLGQKRDRNKYTQWLKTNYFYNLVSEFGFFVVVFFFTLITKNSKCNYAPSVYKMVTHTWIPKGQNVWYQYLRGKFFKQTHKST